MKLIIGLLFVLVATTLGGQSKHDYNWLMGVEQTTDPTFPINCMNLLNFNDEELSIEKLQVDYPMYLSNASISDNDGNLLFYTNGCDVKDRQHNIMPNGDGLNPGIIHDDFCPDAGYTSDGIIILPQPNVAVALLHEHFSFGQMCVQVT
jgi:hypothetical protein